MDANKGDNVDKNILLDLASSPVFLLNNADDLYEILPTPPLGLKAETVPMMDRANNNNMFTIIVGMSATDFFYESLRSVHEVSAVSFYVSASASDV